jgi:hypothetical protein
MQRLPKCYLSLTLWHVRAFQRTLEPKGSGAHFDWNAVFLSTVRGEALAGPLWLTVRLEDRRYSSARSRHKER